jgi:uncharacterized protein DUF1707
MSALGEHLSTGRLEVTEYEDRCGHAAAARTRVKLEALFDDLPVPHPDLSSATPPARRSSLPVVGEAKDPELSRTTRASEAMGVAAGIGLFSGIPLAIFLTISRGMWWTLISVVLFVIVAGVLGGLVEKPPAADG